MSDLIIPEDKLNKRIVISDITNYKINESGESTKYLNYYFLNVSNVGNGDYSLTIVEKDKLKEFKEKEECIFDSIKLSHQSDLDKEILLRDELRRNKLIYQQMSRDYNMSNYHYIYFNTDTELSVTDDVYIIRNIILKYSYPSCMNINYNLSYMEKQNIINDEFNFMSEKLKEYNTNIILIQVPNIIYNLYNIYIQYNLKIIDNIEIIKLVISELNYKSYCDLILKSYNINYIRNINNRLITILYDIFKMRKEMNNQYWLDVLHIIIEKIYIFSFYKNILINTGNTSSVELLLSEKVFNEGKNKKILEETLKIELENISSDTIILYRGSDSVIENIYKEKCISNYFHFNIHSLSFNTSLLNGIFADTNACTPYYYKNNDYKHYLIIKKHFYNDKSIESEICIPPVHPVLLINMSGELFHARTKIYNDTDSDTITGIFINKTNIPDYLKLNLSCIQMFDKYNAIKKLQLKLNDYKKYLKYKKSILH